jgi:ParB family chromosome partitioning protein
MRPGHCPSAAHRGPTRLHVEMDGQDYQLVVSVAPAREGHLYVRPLTGGPRRLAPAAALKLRGFVTR